jgi:TldD protein
MQMDLKPFREDFTHHTELRAHENSATTIQMVKGSLTANSRAVTGGASARVYRNGFWGFASVPKTDRDSMKTIIGTAGKNASFLAGKGKRRAYELDTAAYANEFDLTTRKPRLGQQGLIDFIKSVDNYITKKYPSLTSRVVTVRNLDMEKTVETSYGSSFYSFTPRAHVMVALTAEKDGKPIEINDVVGGLGQFEDVFIGPEDIYAKIDELHTHLMKKRDGIYPRTGEHDVILAPDLAGILAHEAIGHTTEADIVQGGSIAGDYMNQQIASPLVNLVDFAHTAFGQTCPVPVYADDEGTEAKDCVVIENGILKSFMHSKESAEHFGVKPTGNSRAWEFKDEPLIRMRNTVILPGKSKLDEMISSIEDGYFLMMPGNGQADVTSEFMFAVRMGYEIKGGKLGRAIMDSTISGVAFDMLKTVSMISDDMQWESAGFCGKKQIIPVGMGGPAIKCRITMGGK